MRRQFGGAALALLFAGAAAAQQQPADTSRAAISKTRLAAELALLKLSGADGRIPPADSFTTGDRLIPAGSTVHGSVGVAGGKLEISGEVDGSAIALGGDVVVHRGGIVTGDAMSSGGKVIIDGGRVNGEMRSVATASRALDLSVPTKSAPLTTWQALKLALGWFAVLVIIGFGVLIFAETNLDGVVAALESAPVKSFWLGVLAQIAVLPGLLLLCVGLAITLIGVLLVPFAVVAYVIAFAGVVTLGFLAVARLTGSVVARGAVDPSARGVHLSALFVGLVLYFALWFAAAACISVPVAGDVLRGLALAVTWVVASAGLGAALVSRAGTSRENTVAQARRAAPDELAWQTPTPITGVAAARRPASRVNP